MGYDHGERIRRGAHQVSNVSGDWRWDGLLVVNKVLEAVEHTYSCAELHSLVFGSRN